jgi:hypothetical protein
MRNLRARRFGARVVERGKYKEALHVATRTWQRFRDELLVLDDYLDTWILPQEGEETRMTRIMLNLQNILEHESELAIATIARRSGKTEDNQFNNSIEQGYVSFKSKFEWLFRKGMITESEKNVMDEIRRIRNEQIHLRPTKMRTKHRYFDTPLMSHKALIQILADLKPLVEKLRNISGSKEKRGIIPPRFFDEERREIPGTQY